MALHIIIFLLGITSVYGYIEVISSSFSDIRPRFLKLKPLVTFLVLSLVFLMDLVLATRAGLHVYHLLYTYLATWPCLMIVLLTLLTATWSHGTRHVMRDLADLSKVTLPHWVTSHVSVIYTTVAPGLIIAGKKHGQIKMDMTSYGRKFDTKRVPALIYSSFT